MLKLYVVVLPLSVKRRKDGKKERVGGRRKEGGKEGSRERDTRLLTLKPKLRPSPHMFLFPHT